MESYIDGLENHLDGWNIIWSYGIVYKSAGGAVWTTGSSTHKTFTFPDIEDNTVILHASFDHLKVVYNIEVNSILKQAFKLTLKSLFPHSIERQNVRLALNFFDDSTAKALINMGPKHAQLLNWKGTSTFILVIIKLWDMLNIKSYGKGIRLRKSDANCFESINNNNNNNCLKSNIQCT